MTRSLVTYSSSSRCRFSNFVADSHLKWLYGRTHQKPTMIPLNGWEVGVVPKLLARVDIGPAPCLSPSQSTRST